MLYVNLRKHFYIPDQEEQIFRGLSYLICKYCSIWDYRAEMIYIDIQLALNILYMETSSLCEYRNGRLSLFDP